MRSILSLRVLKHEEKETDVNVAMGVVEALVSNEADCAVIVSGDTDLLAAIRCAKNLFPTKRVGVLMPAYRSNIHTKSVADFVLKIKPKHYEIHQLPNPVIAKNGIEIIKPDGW